MVWGTILMPLILSVTVWGMKQGGKLPDPITGWQGWGGSEPYEEVPRNQDRYFCCMHVAKTQVPMSYPVVSAKSKPSEGSSGNEKVNSKRLGDQSFRVEKYSCVSGLSRRMKNHLLHATCKLWAHGIYTLLICIWVTGRGPFKVPL